MIEVTGPFLTSAMEQIKNENEGLEIRNILVITDNRNAKRGPRRSSKNTISHIYRYDDPNLHILIRGVLYSAVFLVGESGYKLDINYKEVKQAIYNACLSRGTEIIEV